MTREERARTLAHQTEAFAIADVAMSALLEATRRNAEAYAALKRIKTEIVAANTLVSGPQYVSAPEAVAS